MTEREQYQLAISEVKSLMAEGSPMAGAIRANWRFLEKALGHKGFVSIQRFAQDIDCNAGSVKNAVHRIRKEEQEDRERRAMGLAPAPESDQQEREDFHSEQSGRQSSEKEDQEPGGLLAKFQQKKSDSNRDPDSEIAQRFDERERKSSKRLADKYGKLDTE